MRQLSREVLELIDYNLKKRDYYKEDNNLSNIYMQENYESTAS